ncbi:radical SAM protein, partial [candidate division WOR-3 bacterium]|nr:radical SAM protein [candidate division WOR-3 bacterium]
YIKSEKIKNEFIFYIDNNPDPDYITFSGSGEPTLNIKIGEILNFIKGKKPDIPVAVLTNGTLLWDDNVKKALLDADVVLPSLDAATQGGFEKINRPVKGLSIEKYIQGIENFKKVFKGKLWLEVFILPGYNDSEAELTALKKSVERIEPDIVQLNTLDRPGTVPNLKRATNKDFQRVINLWKMENVEIISFPVERKNIQSYRKDFESMILETIARRPCTVDDLSKILGLHSNEINKYLSVLEEEGKIEGVEQDRGTFYQLMHD